MKKRGDYSGPRQQSQQSNPDMDSGQEVFQERLKEKKNAEGRGKPGGIDIAPILPKPPNNYEVDNGGIDDTHVPYKPPSQSQPPQPPQPPTPECCPICGAQLVGKKHFCE